MAIETVNEKLALMSWLQPWQMPLPASTDGLGLGDTQQLLWGYPGVFWLAPVVVVPLGQRIDLRRYNARVDLQRGG